MKVGINFHTVDEYISGVDHYALGLLNALLQVDTQNEYLVYTNQPDLVSREVAQSENLKIAGVKHLKTRIARILWEHIQLPRLAAQHRLDVLHCLSYICPLRRTSAPCVVTVHDTIAIDHPQWCKKTNAIYFNLVMKSAVKRASCVISLSKCTAEDVRRNLGLPGSKVRVIYPGTDNIFRESQDVSRRGEVRRRHNLPERYILYVGNVEPKKNTGTLLRVQRRICEKGLPHKLVVVGKRSWRSQAQLAQMDREAASGNVVRAGYVESKDLPLVYGMADVFVFPSLYEGFGFPPLEAMACGTPVVSSDKGALAETVKDAAIIVEPHDVEQITEAVVSLIADSALRKKHVRLGLRQSRLFDWQKTARETLSVYEEVVEEYGR
ncbi:MAG: glycosyltransferase family 4 protein [Planctomycetota bacterium]